MKAKNKVESPDRPGRWRVRHRNGGWFSADVRLDDGGLSARFDFSERWHPIEWINDNGWGPWILTEEIAHTPAQGLPLVEVFAREAEALVTCCAKCGERIKSQSHPIAGSLVLCGLCEDDALNQKP